MADSRVTAPSYLGIQLGAARFALSRAATTIGRDLSSHILLPHKMVSRHHALITYDGEVAVIRDADSSHGTFVNTRVLTKPHLLREGDLVWIGIYSLKVCSLARTGDTPLPSMMGTDGCFACRSRGPGQGSCRDCREGRRSADKTPAGVRSESVRTTPPSRGAVDNRSALLRASLISRNG